jgi:glycosyltransferase involved in cell wall biosynthesis
VINLFARPKELLAPRTRPEQCQLNLFVDGIIYGLLGRCGVSTYFNQLLPRLGSHYPVNVHLLLPPRCKDRGPGRPVRRWRREVFPQKVGLSWQADQYMTKFGQCFNSMLMNRRVRSRQPALFHSTYLTRVAASIPQVATAYDMNQELFPSMYADDWGQGFRNQYRCHLERATRVIAISEKTKKDLVHYYNVPPSRVDVVYLAADRSVFWPERDPQQLKRSCFPKKLRQPYFLYVGGRYCYKNFNGLLEAFARSGISKDVTLAVAGPGWTKDENERIDRLRLRDRIVLVEHPSDAMLRTLFSLAVAFIYPSWHEGFGIALLEAMACGTPVLASGIEVFKEVAGDAVFYFDPHDPESMADALRRCLSEDFRQDFVRQGFECIERYSWELCAQQTYRVYQRALAAVAD